jgi:choline dehydrogenase
VHRVLLEDGGAVGLEVDAGGERGRVYGRRLTLAAGAIGSPAILLRSGIGPEEALVDLGIEPAVHLPGVGANLSDHPVTRLLLVPKPGSCEHETPLAQVVLRYTAAGSAEFNDMQQVLFSHVDVASLEGNRPLLLWARRSRSAFRSRSSAPTPAATYRWRTLTRTCNR